MIDEIDIALSTPEQDGQTPLDPDEASGLLPDWIATRADLNLAEEQNIATGIAWAVRAIKRQAVLNQEFLRALHKNMFGRVWQWAGQYRDTERNIGVAPHAITSDLMNLLQDARTWDEFETYSYDERAARLHHRLTVIHPFPNGNGRCARVFTDLYLEQRNAIKFTWGYGLPPDVQRTSYLAAIRAADAHDYSALLALLALLAFVR